MVDSVVAKLLVVIKPMSPFDLRCYKFNRVGEGYIETRLDQELTKLLGSFMHSFKLFVVVKTRTI